jgi:hypothetical protein
MIGYGVWVDFFDVNGKIRVSNFDWPCFRARKPRIYHIIFHVKLEGIARTEFKNERFEFKLSRPHLVHGTIAAAFLTTARDYSKQRWVLAMVVI